MIIKELEYEFTVCKIKDEKDLNLEGEFTFIGKTDSELSLVCPIDNAPDNTLERADGWKGFRIEGELDFSLIGILAEISKILADNKIGIFAVSTYNTDYIFVKKESFEKAISSLADNGYEIK